MGPLITGNRYAVVTSTIALVIALSGGTAYAAGLITSSDIANGGVKRADLHKGAVNSGKVADGSLRKGDFKPGQLPTGPTGPAGPLLDTLPTGRTLRGTFGLYGHGNVDSGLEAASQGISFPLPLSADPSAKVVQSGTASSPPECPGTAAAPEAAPGWLCIYENRAQNQRSGGYPTVSKPGSGGGPSSGRFGASLIVQGQAAGTDWFYWSEGTWAVTAP
jgi:hypothetical protein